MVWPFKKREIVDLTERKVSLLKKSEKKIPVSAVTGGYADLTSKESVDLFSAISAANEPSSSKERSIHAAFTNRVEDIEFKLDNLRKKLDDLLNRLEVVEKKSGVHGY